MQRLIVIVGPTASGKTDIAIQLAQELNGRVVSADSRQVYAGMNIGTAKPELARQEVHEILEPDIVQGVAHYLFNIRQPDEPLSLSEWQAAAFACINTVHDVGMPAVLAGGTMLYIDSIVKNYDLPNVAPNALFRETKEKEPTDALYAELLEYDPAARDFIEPQNKRRIIRALEVMAATNKTFSGLRRQRPSPYDVIMIGLFDSWEALELRISDRVGAMLEGGLVAETQGLIDAYGADLPLLQTINYKQALAIIQGELSAEAALHAMIRANIRYARRQMSWWKDRQDITWYSPYQQDEIKKAVAH